MGRCRGYLGLSGLGSTYVWHGQGSFGHFNSLGSFLCSLILFFIPIRYFLLKNKFTGNIAFLILLFGIIVTYSRNALLALTLVSLFFLFNVQKNKIKFTIILLLISLFAFTIWSVLKNTSYMYTINPRDDVWNVSLAAITQNIHTLLFGSGLKSIDEAIFLYMPGNEPLERANFWQSHSFYLYNIVELGLIGTSILILFYINNIYLFIKNLKNRNKLIKALNMSGCILILSIFLLGIFDLAFNMFAFQVYVFLTLGFIHSKNSSEPLTTDSYKQSIADTKHQALT